MDLILMGIAFFAQFICSMAVRHKLWKYTPTLILTGMLSLVVLNASLSEPDPQAMAMLTMLILAGVFGAMLQMSITLIFKRMKDRK